MQPRSACRHSIVPCSTPDHLSIATTAEEAKMAQPQTKLEEQATAKADLSYSYWAANAAGEAPPPQPKKLSEQEAAAQAEQLKHVASGASAWNAAGTMEERSVPLGWVREQLDELLAAVEHSHGGVSVRVVAVTSCSGEAHQWIVRGKKRAGFELVIEFSWRAELGGAAVTGTAKVPHAAADELDELQLEVKPDAAAAKPDGESGEAAGGEPAPEATAEQRSAAQAAVSSMLPRLEELLGALLERIRQR